MFAFPTHLVDLSAGNLLTFYPSLQESQNNSLKSKEVETSNIIESLESNLQKERDRNTAVQSRHDETLGELEAANKQIRENQAKHKSDMESALDECRKSLSADYDLRIQNQSTEHSRAMVGLYISASMRDFRTFGNG